MNESEFIFVVCQHRAESALKAELLREHPELRLAFSRPGFVTCKLLTDLPKNFILRSTFARTYGWSLGACTGNSSDQLIEQLKPLIANRSFDQLHVWERDAAIPGQGGFEPFPTELATCVGNLLAEDLNRDREVPLVTNQPATADQTVLDVIIIEPTQWWIGWHVAATTAARWVGGVPPLVRDDELISRAYYKIAEACAWSHFPLRRGDLVVELGSAPGGASEFLLEQGASVFAIDPAPLDPAIAEHPRLMHLQMRSKDVRKKEVAGARWLVADLNVAPNYTLDTVEEFVGNQHLHFRGLILTLKLTRWELADALHEFRQRVRQWGFDVVKTRQLAFNRREVCLVAIRDRIDIRSRRR